MKLQKEIISGLGINPDWWHTGKGVIYREKGTPVKEPSNLTDEVALLIAQLNITLAGYRADLDALKAENKELKERLKRYESGKN